MREKFVPEIQQVKRALPFSNPDEYTPEVEPAVTSIGHDEYYGDRLKPREKELLWGAKSLAQKGTIRFTSYEER